MPQSKAPASVETPESEQQISVAELPPQPEELKFDIVEKLALDDYGKRYRDREQQVQQQIQETVSRLQQDLKHHEGQLVGAVHMLLKLRKLNPEDYDINLGDAPHGRVTVRQKTNNLPELG